MFMDDALQIKPSDLDMGLDNQLNLFTMEHESQYGPLINELIEIFIPPEHATPEEMETAKGMVEVIRNKELINRFIEYLRTHDYGNESEVEKIYSMI